MKDKTGAFFVFVFPFLIILAIGAAFGSGFTPQLGRDAARVGGAGAGSPRHGWRRPRASTSGVYTDADAMRTAIERGELEGGLVIPPGYDERIRAGETVPIDFIARPTAGTELQLTVASVVDAQNVEVRAARFAVAEGAAPSFDEGLAGRGGRGGRCPPSTWLRGPQGATRRSARSQGARRRS